MKQKTQKFQLRQSYVPSVNSLAVQQHPVHTTVDDMQCHHQQGFLLPRHTDPTKHHKHIYQHAGINS